jgi:hypothetical protein
MTEKAALRKAEWPALISAPHGGFWLEWAGTHSWQSGLASGEVPQSAINAPIGFQIESIWMA